MVVDLLIPYGQECIIDVHQCSRLFTRASIETFLEQLCELLGMTREDLHFWDYHGPYSLPGEYDRAPAHMKGTSAVQFIRTSNITIHTLDDLKAFYLNVFSCKPFDAAKVKTFVQEWTAGAVVNFVVLSRV